MSGKIVGQCKVRGTLLWPSLWEKNEAKVADESTPKDPKKARWSADIRISKSDTDTLSVLRNAMKEVYTEAKTPDVKKWRPTFRREEFFETHLSEKNQDGFPLRDGDLRDGDIYANCAFIRATERNKRPLTAKVVGNGVFTKLMTKDRVEEELYSGSECDFILQFYYYPNKTSPSGDKVEEGIGCKLMAVIKIADGDPIGGMREPDLSEYGYGSEIGDKDSDNIGDVNDLSGKSSYSDEDF